MTHTIEYLGHTVYEFDPEEVIRSINGEDRIGFAFHWGDTPQGFDFWNAEDDKNGNYSKEARDVMIEMLYLWNEQHPDEAVAIPWVRPGSHNKEEIQDEVGRERVEYHSIGFILDDIVGSVKDHGAVKSVTINSTGITVEFHK